MFHEVMAIYFEMIPRWNGSHGIEIFPVIIESSIKWGLWFSNILDFA